MSTDTKQAHKVTTFDVCASGFERLRSYSEYILVAYIDADTDSAELLEQWESDLQSCDRDDDFNYDAAREAIQAFYTGDVHPLFNRRSNPFSLEPRTDEDEESCQALLYIKVEGAHFPVY